jgi:RNA polymerase sigma-70 factor, ECF subfamily
MATAQDFVEPIAAEPMAPALELDAVYATWFPSVYRWVRAQVGPHADFEDITQDVFVVVQRKLAGFDGQNLAGWLYRITQRTVSDYRRRSWFRNLFQRPREIAFDEIHTSAANQSELLERSEEQRRFYRVVARMNKKWRDAFVLFEIDGYSGDEIACMQGIPAATVRTHLHRARKQFLELVAKEMPS